MATRYVLVVVNVAKAILEKNLSKYVYVMGSTGYVGVNGGMNCWRHVRWEMRFSGLLHQLIRGMTSQ